MFRDEETGLVLKDSWTHKEWSAEEFEVKTWFDLVLAVKGAIGFMYLPVDINANNEDVNEAILRVLDDRKEYENVKDLAREAWRFIEVPV